MNYKPKKIFSAAVISIAVIMILGTLGWMIASPYDFMILVLGLLPILIATFAIAGILITDVYQHKLQDKDKKHPYAYGLKVTIFIGVIAVIIIRLNMESLETFIGGTVFSILYLIVSTIAGLFIGNSIEKNTTK